jgi:hypothetical protein
MWEVAMYPAATERTSTFMTNRLLLFVLIASFTANLALAQSRTEQGTLTLEQRVARLGAPGNDDAADVKQLAENPEASAKVLIAALHTIPDSEEFAKADKPSMEHVLWLIRALRYLTGGLDFCAQSKHIFGNSEEEENRQYWLTFHHKDCLTFFGYWMSRDRTYIAPEDTQKRIIDQWRHWYAKFGATYEYKPLRNPPPEKWLW